MKAESMAEEAGLEKSNSEPDFGQVSREAEKNHNVQENYSYNLEGANFDDSNRTQSKEAQNLEFNQTLL